MNKTFNLRISHRRKRTEEKSDLEGKVDAAILKRFATSLIGRDGTLSPKHKQIIADLKAAPFLARSLLGNPVSETKALFSRFPQVAVEGSQA